MNEIMNEIEEKKSAGGIMERLKNGVISENPTFVLMLGMCPTLAVTTSAINGLGMGLTTMVVLALSNLFISLLRKIIPDKVRIPAFIVIIASFVTVMQLLLQAYIPFLYDALGIYIPLIVVNCIILGRAEAYASKNSPVLSLFDGMGMGLGFTLALTCIGAVRELLGAGELFGFPVLPTADHPWVLGGTQVSFFTPISIFIMAPGAFFVLAALTAIQNAVRLRGEKRGRDMSKIQSGCSEDCMNCMDAGCGHRFYDTAVVTPDTSAAAAVAENKTEKAAYDLMKKKAAEIEIEDLDQEERKE